MKQLYKSIIENTTSGNIKKDTAVEMIKLIKQYDDAVIEDVAVIGMSVQYPLAENKEKFWWNIRNGLNTTGEFPHNRTELVKDYLNFKGINIKEDTFTKGSYLDDISNFDYKFFNITPKEAELLEPNQRIFLQNIYHTIEDSGYVNDIKGSKTGVFLGFANELRETYINWLKECNPETLPLSVAGNLSSIIPARISFFKDLIGPSIVIDTACSSSLVAVHLACNAIRVKDCEKALVGGIRINLLPLSSDVKIGIESSDGKTKSFDNDSDGTGSGEGVASILLKPLKAALRDKDNIYAVIKGSAVNQDGASAGITAPNLISQKKVIIEAWKNAKIDPESIAYIEAHGTATKLGDPIEIEAITEAFKEYTDKKQFCAISSVKSNLGHLYEAAGITGLIKSILCLKNKEIPETANFNYPNSRIHFEDSPVYVNDQLIPWESNGMPRRCGVSSFGFSGTNCHVVLEEAPKIEEIEESTDESNIFTLSAKSKESLKNFLLEYSIFLETTENSFEEICYGTNVGKEYFSHRVGIIANNKIDLYNKIRMLITNDLNIVNDNKIVYGYHNVASHGKKVLSEGDITLKEKKSLTLEAIELIKSNEKGLYSILNLYVKGADIQWESYYNNKMKKISLPLYPFERNKCWFKIVESSALIQNNNIGEIIHPLVEKLMVESMDHDIYITEFSVKKHFVLKDHVILDNNVIPGTTYIEMANKIGKEYYGEVPLEIKGLTFVKPIHVIDEEVKTVQTIVDKERDYLSIKIVSKNNENTWDIHAFGEIYKSNAKSIETFDIAELKGKFESNAINIDQNQLTDGFIKFGPRWINYKKLYKSQELALGELSLDEQFKDDLNHYDLHPSLLDMAVNIVSLTLGERYLPLSYDKINIYGPTTMNFYSLVEFDETKIKGDTINFNLKLINENGQVFLTVENYILKKVREFNKMLKNNYFYSTVNFIEKEIDSQYESLENEKVMVIHNNCSLSKVIIEKLIDKKSHIVDVIVSENYEKKSDNNYYLGKDEQDYIKLFEDIKSKKINYIINVFDGDSQDDINDKIKSLFNLSKGLNNYLSKEKLKIVIITKNRSELKDKGQLIDPINASLHSMAKVISKEQNIIIKSIDIDEEINIEKVINEIESNEIEYLVVYRNGKRCTEVVEKLNIEEIPYSNIEIKENGTYIITGGIGGIGLEISKYLASKSNVNLMLINRSKFPRRELWDNIISIGENSKIINAISIIKLIESKGSKVDLYSCDVSNESELSEVLKDIRGIYTHIDGVFHGAGNPGNGFIIKKSWEEFSNVINPKIKGTELLHKLTLEDNIDFLVLSSSVASILALPGQSDYTVANSFMDSFSYYRNMLGFKTISINWTAWNETGMAVDNNANFDTLFKTINTSVAIENLNELLFRDVPRAIVGKWNYSDIIYPLANLNYSSEIFYILQKQKELENNKASSSELVEVILKGRDNNIYSELESTLGGIWAKTLGYKEINIYDDFYDLGGDSIIAVRLVNNINKELNTNINVASVFNYLTINEFAKYIEDNIYKTNEGNKSNITLTKVEKREYYPATSGQRGIYLACKYENSSRIYNLPLVMEAIGEYSIEKLKDTFKVLINRHEGLRTTFEFMDEELVQRVKDNFDFNINVVNCDAIELDKTIYQLIKPFDLSHDLLIRVNIINTSDSRTFIFIDTHHIIADGYSMAILLKDFLAIYGDMDLPELKFTYSDYSVWQNTRDSKNELEDQKTYWMNKFKELPEVLNFTTDYPRESTRGFEGDYITFNFDNELSKKIKQLANNNKSTNFTTLFTAFNILLYKYTGEKDIIVGSSISGRLDSNFEKIVGMFINMLPIRTAINNHSNFIETLKSEQEEILESINNQEYNFDDIVSNLEMRRDPSRNPLFDFCFNLQNITKEIEITDVGTPEFYFDLNGLELKSFEIKKKISKYDFMVEVIENNSGFKGYIEYNTKLFNKETMEQIANNFINILNQIVINPEVKINDIDLMTDEEKNKIVYEFNNNKMNFDEDKLLHMILEEKANQYPERIALCYENEEISYNDLNESANRMARYFQKCEVVKENLVALLLPRCPNMVKSILGLWKVGSAYIPLDVNYPLERIVTILEDSGAKYLLTYSEFVTKELEEALGNRIIQLDLIDEEIKNMNGSNLELDIEKGTLAYVIYTSGSTGKPKGAMIEHVGMMNHILAKINDIELNDESIIVQNASQCFDISVWQFFAAIACGGKTVIYSNEVAMNPKDIISRVIHEKVTILEVVPSYLSVIIDYIVENNIRFKELKYVLVTGETLKSNLVKKWFEICSDVKIVNAYGPTEASDDITHYIISENPVFANIPIGKPVQNMNIYIIDKDDKLCPIGVKGEIVVSGIGVGRGYLNDEKRTNAVFLEDKYINETGVRLYKTGDLGRWLSDGTIEFFGRKDYQVKIRGFRIELGEIESKLMVIENVKECVVIDLEDDLGNKYLVAYMVSEELMNIPNIKEELKKSLPDYMMPSFFVQLEKLPLSSNGKIDRKALPKPEGSLEDRVQYLAPRNEVEENMVSVWKEILGVDRIGINDNFFELGGDSIKAIRIISKVNKFGYTIELKDIFIYSTVKELVGRIKFDEENNISQETVVGRAELIPVQQWFVDKNFTDKHHWNQSVMLYKKDGLDKELLQQTFQRIVEHHDALRMSFNLDLDKDYQYNRDINDGVFYDINEFDVKNIENHKDYIINECNKLHGQINLVNGPLVKVAIFREEEGDHLFIAIHHMVVDGVSWRILLEELSTVYMSLGSGQEVNLPLKTNSYKEWTENLMDYSNSKEIEIDREYWQELSKNEVKSLPIKFSDDIRTVSTNKDITIEFTVDETKDLLRNVNKAYNTDVNDILLAALGLTINKWTEYENVLINLEGHGRNNIHKDINITRTIGWFTTEYPVILEVKDSENISLMVKETKENLRHIPNEGISYGVLKYLSLNKLNDNLQPEICFNYLGQFDEEIESSIFEMSTIGTGDNVSLQSENTFVLDINGVIETQKLKIIFTYSEKDLDEEVVLEIANSYKDNLIKIIDHCKDKKIIEKTPSDYNDKILSLEELKGISEKYESQFEIEKIYGLTSLQEGMIFEYLMDKEGYSNVNQFVFNIEGQLDLDILEKSFQGVIDKHDSLRTVFVYDGLKEQKQVVLKERKVSINYKDYSNLEDIDSRVNELVLKEIEKPLNLESDTLLSLSLFKLGENRHQLILNYHHIIMDGWSIPLITRDLFQFYTDILEDRQISTTNTYEYGDFIVYLRNKDREEGKEYWTNYLKDYQGETNLPEKAVIDKTAYIVKEQLLNIDTKVVDGLTKIIQKEKITLNNLMEATWGIILQKYNNLDDIIFGKVVSGRNAPVDGIEEIAGLFINTIPVRVKSEDDMTVIDLAKEIKLQSLESEKYDYYSLSEIQMCTEQKRDLINNILVFQNYYIDDVRENIKDSTGLDISFNSTREQTKYNLNLEVELDEGIRIRLRYNEGLYDNETINRVINNIKNLLNQIVINAEVKINDIDLMTVEEKNKILYGFNKNKIKFDEDKLLHMILEERAKENPERIALGYENEEISYNDLNESANRMARYFQKKEVVKEDLVALLIPRCPMMMESILGLWKLGSAYIPLDINYPIERIVGIVEDSGAKYLLTYSEYVTKELEEALGNRLIKLDLIDEEILNLDISNLELEIEKGTLAYVIYTSGSTGKPKGAMIEQVGMMNHMLAKINDIELNKESIIVQNASQCFDISVWQFFVAIACGGKTVIYSNDVAMNPKEIISRIIRDKVTILEVVPSYLSVIIDYIKENNIRFKELKYVLVTGETLKSTLVKKWFEICSDVKMVNAYGPTEASDDITHYIISEDIGLSNIPIGKPVQNMNIYIIDKDEKLCEIGVKGEIVVSGIGVGRGYLNDEKRTNAVFLEDKYINEIGVRLYKTGDLGRWLSDGTIEFFGRKDYQVKIRGFRIELGEIESKLMIIKNVKECVVIDLEDELGSKYLVAYMVSEESIEIPMEMSKIKEELKKSLPDYMIPAFFVQLEQLPLSSNGKIDRKALPKPEGSLEDRIQYQAPRNEVEENMVSVWKETLGVDRIGINDNFFELGGDSIKAIRIISKVNKFGYTIELKDIFVYSTVEELVGRIKFNEESNISQEAVVGRAGLIPVQQWFVDKNFTDKHHWNQSVMLYKKDGLDRELVEKTFQKIVEHHDALRMNFNHDEDKYYQYNRDINDGVFYDIKEYDVKDIENHNDFIVHECNKLHGGMNLENGPLIKIGIFREEEGDHLFIAIHHMVIDGVSWRILLEELSSVYISLESGQEVNLPLKTNSYKEWTEHLMDYSNSKEIEDDREYWQELGNNVVEGLPIKISDEISTIFTNKDITIEFTEEETKDLLRNVNKAYNTEVNDILLAALGLTINKWTKYRNILVNLEGHGRDEIHKDINITRTIGWFTTEYPVLLEVKDSEDISLMVKETKENLRHIPNKGISYGVLKYLSDNKLTDNLEPEICFNYLGQFDEEIESSIFEISNIGTGNNVSLKSENTFVFDINGVVEKQKLKIVFTYSETDLDEETVLKVANGYRDNLIKIINHCKEKKVTEKTASDFEDNLKFRNNNSQIIYPLTDSQKQGFNENYPLARSEKRLMIVNEINKEDLTYNTPFVLDVDDDLDITKLEDAFKRIVEKNEIMRTSFAFEDGLPVQRIHSDANFKVNLVETEIEDEKEVIKSLIYPFQLDQLPLFRVNLIKMKKGKQMLLIDIHHIISDGVSIEIMVEDLIRVYNGFPTKDLEIQYKDFSVWQENYFNSDYIKEMGKYWLNKLENFTYVAFPKKNLNLNNYLEGAKVEFYFDKEDKSKIRKYCIERSITKFSFFASILNVILKKELNIEDITIGVPVTGRNIEQLQDMIGMFTNVILLRTFVDGKIDFKEYIKISNETLMDALANQDYPYEELHEQVSEKYKLNNQSLYSIMINYLPYESDGLEEIRLGNTTLKYSESQINIPKSDIIFYIYENKDNFRIEIIYKEEQFNDSIIERLTKAFKDITDTVLDNDRILIRDIEYVTQNSSDELVDDFEFEFDNEDFFND